jgi:hypothetical protein
MSDDVTPEGSPDRSDRGGPDETLAGPLPEQFEKAPKRQGALLRCYSLVHVSISRVPSPGVEQKARTP